MNNKIDTAKNDEIENKFLSEVEKLVKMGDKKDVDINAIKKQLAEVGELLEKKKESEK